MTRQTYLSCPAIGALLGFSRQNARKRALRGDFGRIRHIRHRIYVAQSTVERRVGLTFSHEQIERATEGRSFGALVFEADNGPYVYPRP